MDYELAKELRDAGFPQEKKEGHIVFEDDSAYALGAYAPTLEELIEACGDGIIMINRNSKHQWFASKGIVLEAVTEEGSTPVEAMAGLYISLKSI